MSAREHLRESLKDKWAKYIIASVLIHGAVLAVPFPFMVQRMTGPIEVFILEGSGSSAPSGGYEKQDISRSKPRREIYYPVMKEEVRMRPQTPSRSVEPEVQPVEAAAETIIAHEPSAWSDPVEEMQIAAGATASGRQEDNLSSSSSRSGMEIAGGSDPGGGPGETDAEFGSPSGPRFLHREIPEYPFFARKRKIEGKVVLTVVIDATGRLTRTEVIEASDKVFVETSLEALKKSTFLPARRNGQPVTSRALLPIRFSLVD